MSVPAGSYEFTATHEFTKRLSAMELPDAVAALPVPTSYRPANSALAQQLDLGLRGALTEPRGCLQIIVQPAPAGGSLFAYGIYPISGAYCS